MAGDRIWFTGGGAPTMCVWMIFSPHPHLMYPRLASPSRPWGWDYRGKSPRLVSAVLGLEPELCSCYTGALSTKLQPGTPSVPIKVTSRSRRLWPVQRT